MKEQGEKNMLSVWLSVGIILIVYGGIIISSGIFYLFKPETITALYYLNPSLWWGGIMFISGLLLIYAGRKTEGEKH